MKGAGMAGKPLDQLSPAYRRRIERAMARGKSRQQARGHKPQEHIERKEREIADAGLSLAQSRIVFMWAANRSFQIKDSDFDADEVLEWAQSVGYEAFKKYRNKWDGARRTYLKEIRNGSWSSRGLGYLGSIDEDGTTPDISWLYYH